MALNLVRKLALKGVALMASLFGVFIVVRSYRAESALFDGQRRIIELSSEARAIPHLRSVAFNSRSGQRLRGWYVPSRNQAAVVLTHGTQGDRRNGLPEAALLAAHGFGILLFDFPGHGESEGEIHWDEGEAASLLGALDFLAEQPEVNAERLGTAGYSMGGLIAVRVAAVDPRVRALALVGTPSDVGELVRLEYRRWGALGRVPALLALKHHGMTLDRDQPLALVARIAPRELLVVGGANDDLIPPAMTESLFAAAREPKQLYIVPNASHGAYLEADPVTYPTKLVEFFERALTARTP